LSTQSEGVSLQPLSHWLASWFTYSEILMGLTKPQSFSFQGAWKNRANCPERVGRGWWPGGVDWGRWRVSLHLDCWCPNARECVLEWVESQERRL